ncbi:PDR/VanB family oxidoreductase [Amycolatopsis pithecellobii]|uniref:2Fe-2S iron-sulfur cluster binding domain-containing protein n=1 Tax=Amycolatopsis pithecellobii TaxID=664692 RepID=A0A6N7Z397_9PSEU|nr:PDR/VanB family oxidoreductase [Amycolatopsis pithecellobii]MTD56343.1 2Fe-2S iron-sulfur cluster binding domain-containing protein [Amycolatopsis pithecellobii]
MTVNEFDVLLARKDVIADDVVRLTFHHPDGDELPRWEPGAHVDLMLGNLVRQYSLCGDPGDRSVLEVAVLRERDGRGGSAFVHDGLRTGDLVRIGGPRNHFPLVPAESYLFIAGGIGITPIVPMIAAADASRADWQLVYGGRARSSMAFHEELSQKYGDRVSVLPQDETGLLDLESLFDEAYEDTAVYCCGPEPLLLAAERAVPEWLSLHVERFAAKENSGERTEFEVELARSGMTLTVPAEQSILDTVEGAGVPVLSSCQGGICGTCETPVLDGVPDHRDSVLSEQEQAANDTMMICVSRACGERLVLDL